jgi:hypothetical protein
MEVQMGLFGHKKKDEEEDILQFDELKDAADPDEEEQDSFQLEGPGEADDPAVSDANDEKEPEENPDDMTPQELKEQQAAARRARKETQKAEKSAQKEQDKAEKEAERNAAEDGDRKLPKARHTAEVLEAANHNDFPEQERQTKELSKMSRLELVDIIYALAQNNQALKRAGADREDETGVAVVSGEKENRQSEPAEQTISAEPKEQQETADDSAGQLNISREKNAELAGRNTDLEAKNKELEAQNSVLTEKNTDLTARNTEITNRITDLENSNKELQSRIDELNVKLQKAAVEQPKTEAAMAESQVLKAEAEKTKAAADAMLAASIAEKAKNEQQYQELQQKREATEKSYAELQQKREDAEAVIKEALDKAKAVEQELKDATSRRLQADQELQAAKEQHEYAKREFEAVKSKKAELDAVRNEYDGLSDEEVFQKKMKELSSMVRSNPELKKFLNR